ncbi:heat shock protein beta-7 isoform X2 [Petromyzon marinus]|uniref:Heat shock protein beta-7 isoform X2 n=1 Tax=Petromyzon marinus TaxID=7757 RepID=A0AAJ7WL81_PETMA|nr:heat shock protein beta-7 isoform X2 [Petromyzon marinus]
MSKWSSNSSTSSTSSTSTFRSERNLVQRGSTAGGRLLIASDGGAPFSLLGESNQPLMGGVSMPVRLVGENYEVSVQVGDGFTPEDIVVTSSSLVTEVHAERLADDGRVSASFHHRVRLPEDADPTSLGAALGPGGALTLTVRRRAAGALGATPAAFRTQVTI